MNNANNNHSLFRWMYLWTIQHKEASILWHLLMSLLLNYNYTFLRHSLRECWWVWLNHDVIIHHNLLQSQDFVLSLNLNPELVKSATKVAQDGASVATELVRQSHSSAPPPPPLPPPLPSPPPSLPPPPPPCHPLHFHFLLLHLHFLLLNRFKMFL